MRFERLLAGGVRFISDMPGRLSGRIILLGCVVSLFFSARDTDPFSVTVPVKGFDPAAYRAESARYLCSSSSESFTLAETPFQRIARRVSDRRRTVIEVAVNRQPGRQGCSDEASFLGDARYLALSSPEIASASDRLKSSEDPLTAVERCVYERITVKTTGIPLVPAPDVWRMQRGDCTEHAVLAVALLRKMGIPARAVVGMYLMPRYGASRDCFVFHMWAEACWKGAWHLVDATRPGERRAERYIAFAYHSLQSPAPKAYLRAVAAIQDLEVSYRGR